MRHLIILVAVALAIFCAGGIIDATHAQAGSTIDATRPR